MKLSLQRILIQVCIFHLFCIFEISSYTYASPATKPENDKFYFRSAKKISGASSLHAPGPSISSSWKSSSVVQVIKVKSRRFQQSNEIDSSDNEDEDIEPGKMRISEIKAELDLREVPYKDCFDKDSLVQRLSEARATGKANPAMLEKFNKQKLEEAFDSSKKVELKDELIASAVANDGKLPGGMSPEQFKKLAGNPEIMSMLQSTKMQEAMKIMMSSGKEELEAKLKDDPELQETLTKLDAIMNMQ